MYFNASNTIRLLNNYYRSKADSASQPTIFVTRFATNAPTRASILPASASPTSGSATSSASSPAATYTPVLPGNVALIDIACLPSGSLTTTVKRQQWNFSCTARTDRVGGDIMGITALTLQQCAEACGNYNCVQGQKACVSVVLKSGMGKTYGWESASCFLKSRLTTGSTVPDGTSLSIQ